jgi:hypothetical protein
MVNSSNSSVINDVQIIGNLIGDQGAYTSGFRTAPATTVYVKGISVSGVNAATITRNNVKNIISFIGTQINAIELASNMGTGNVRIDSNTISTIISNTNTARSSGNATCGVFINSIGGNYTINGNDISTIETYGNFFIPTGIQINNAGASGTIAQNKIYKLFGVYQSGAYGISLQAAGNGMQIQNNFIFNLKNNPTIFNIGRSIVGINIASGSNHKIYHNSVHLYGASSANNPNIATCLMSRNAGYTGLDIRNNIFSNEMTNTATANTAVYSCIYFAFTPAQAVTRCDMP